MKLLDHSINRRGAVFFASPRDMFFVNVNASPVEMQRPREWEILMFDVEFYCAAAWQRLRRAKRLLLEPLWKRELPTDSIFIIRCGPFWSPPFSLQWVAFAYSLACLCIGIWLHFQVQVSKETIECKICIDTALTIRKRNVWSIIWCALLENTLWWKQRDRSAVQWRSFSPCRSISSWTASTVK